MNYVALIRGIMPSNPNMSNPNLCRVIERLGYTNVQAVIASGNVVFSSDETDEQTIERDMSEALRGELGIPGPVLIRCQSELEALLAARPFGNRTHGQTTYLSVTFFADRMKKTELNLPGAEIVHLTTRELCMVTNTEKNPGSDVMRALQKAYGKHITTWTWRTVERILKKVKETNQPPEKVTNHKGVKQ